MKFKKFLKKNVNIFAWSHNEMLGIKLEVIVYHLNVDPDNRLVQ